MSRINRKGKKNRGSAKGLEEAGGPRDRNSKVLGEEAIVPKTSPTLKVQRRAVPDKPLEYDTAQGRLWLACGFEPKGKELRLSRWTLTPLLNLSTLVEEVSSRRTTLSRWPMKQVGIGQSRQEG